jgi:toxin HigB-1
MKVRHDDSDLDRLETDERFTAGIPPAVVKAFRRRMQALRAANDQRDFRANKSWHFEQLRGRRGGEHSVRLNLQFRLIIAFEGSGSDQTVVVLGVEDYH